MAWREDCLHRLGAAAKSTDDVVFELAAITRDLGFEYCSYVLRSSTPISKPAVVWSSTYPSAWLDRYFGNHYLAIDPILQRISQDAAPLTWADTTAEGDGRFWEDAKSYGIRHGWAMASYGRNMSMGMLSLARSASPVTELELAKTEMKLVWLSQLAHSLISAVETKKAFPDYVRELSHREKEILRWSAAGKTADEIASILGITERTVTFHIASVLNKLNVINKTQAVAKAMLLGMLN